MLNSSVREKVSVGQTLMNLGLFLTTCTYEKTYFPQKICVMRPYCGTKLLYIFYGSDGRRIILIPAPPHRTSTLLFLYISGTKLFFSDEI